MTYSTNTFGTLDTVPLRAIDWGTQVDGNRVTYGFADWGQGTTDAQAEGIGAHFTSEGFTSFERAQFRAVFDSIEAVTNLTFDRTNYRNADFQLLLDTNEFLSEDLGLMVPPDEAAAGTGVFNGGYWDRYAGGDLDKGGYSYTTILHEVLHGLGMAHPHDDGGTSGVMDGVYSAFDDLGSYDLNQGVYTALTYNNGLHDGDGVGARASGDLFGFEATPMALDIAVLQAKYGVNTTHNTGATTYDLAGANRSGTYWMSIWDAGGNDMIRYSGTRNATIDLRAATLQNDWGGGGYLSAANGIEGGFTIANGVVIERARGGSGDDTITGNSHDNILSGQGGSDQINANSGSDQVKGGQGGDVLFGGGGEDMLAGEAGTDTLRGGGGNDALLGGGGADAATGGAGRDTLKGEAGEDAMDGGSGHDLLLGGTGHDLLWGNTGDDRLKGARGDDTLRGGGGDDLAEGGSGSDSLNGASGNDTLQGGSGGDTLEGGDQHDRLLGEGGHDTLRGGAGRDWLNGGAGDDDMRGGGGRDTFVFRDADGSDRLGDFNASDDILRINKDLLSGQNSGQGVINNYGSWNGDDYVLDFGDGDAIVLVDLGTLNGLAAAIEIFG